MDDLASIDTTTARGKGVTALIVVAALIFAWFGIRWQVGHMLAVLTRPDANGAYSLAQLAGNWASTDPAAKAFQASSVDDPSADERVDPLPLYEEAVRLGPHDFHLRIALARTLEQHGRVADAEMQFRKAIELAPSYSEPHWNFGNFLLRQNREGAALRELQFAAGGDLTFREQFFSLIWERSGKDESKMVAACGESGDLKAFLAFFFSSHGQAAASLRTWLALSDDDRRKHSATGNTIAQALFIQRHFSESLELARTMGNSAEARAITNGTFEQALESQIEPNFGWRLGKPDARIEVATDNRVSHEGARALRLTFRAYKGPVFINPLQTVVVEPGRRYRVRFWMRTENLRSGGNPLVTIQNGVDDNVIAKSAPAPQGTTDWQEMDVDFAVPDKCEGIVISIGRAYCGEDCPLNGIVWYDDFRLEKL